MAKNIPLIVYPAKDLNKAKEFFNNFLDTSPYTESPYYIGYKAGNLEFGLDPNSNVVISYIDVDNIDERLKTLKNHGAEVTMHPKDVGGGLMVAQVEVEGNTLGLRQPVKK